MLYRKVSYLFQEVYLESIFLFKFIFNTMGLQNKCEINELTL